MLQWKFYAVSSCDLTWKTSQGKRSSLYLQLSNIYWGSFLNWIVTYANVMLSWVSSLLSGGETRNIQSLTVRLGLCNYKLKIFQHNLNSFIVMSSDISFRWWLQASENLRCSCSMQQWRVTSTEHNEYCNWKTGRRRAELFHRDHKPAESHWHSESYTVIIKQLCSSLSLLPHCFSQV